MSAQQFLLLITVIACILLLIDANGGGRLCTDTSREVYRDPGPYCDRTCATLGQLCDKVYIRRPSGCYCMDGFARDDNEKCIPIRTCPRQIYHKEVF